MRWITHSPMGNYSQDNPEDPTPALEESRQVRLGHRGQEERRGRPLPRFTELVYRLVPH